MMIKCNAENLVVSVMYQKLMFSVALHWQLYLACVSRHRITVLERSSGTPPSVKWRLALERLFIRYRSKLQMRYSCCIVNDYVVKNLFLNPMLRMLSKRKILPERGARQKIKSVRQTVYCVEFASICG
ncbi:hypothetical protein DMENIID0001_053210 [Sergentomyia squamirostris]